MRVVSWVYDVAEYWEIDVAVDYADLQMVTEMQTGDLGDSRKRLSVHRENTAEDKRTAQERSQRLRTSIYALARLRFCRFRGLTTENVIYDVHYGTEMAKSG